MDRINFEVNAETKRITMVDTPVVVEKEVNVTAFEFTVPKILSGEDMSGYSWRVWYEIGGKRYFYAITSVVADGDNIVLTWELNIAVTKTAGMLSFSLSAVETEDDEVVTKWNSLPCVVKINSTVGGGVYTATAEEVDAISALVSQINGDADEVRELAEQVAEDAETASQAKDTAVSASTSAVTANTQAQAAKEVIDTAMESFYSLGIVESASGDPASFTDGASNVPMKSVSVGIEPVQSGSGDPSPDNVRPIYGWDEVKVTRCGKNLFDPSKATDGKYINSDGEEGTSATFACSDYIPVHGIRMVYFSGFNGGWGNAPCYALYDKDKRKIRATHPNTNITSFPVTIEGAYYLRTSMAKADKGTVMIEVGDTATSYEAYNGQTYPISLTSAGTVYGGTLDVTNGVLTVEMAMVALQNYTTWGGLYTASGVKRLVSTNYLKGAIAIICDTLQAFQIHGAISDRTLNGIAITADGRFVITPSFIQSSSTADEAKAILMAADPIQLVYELATPITYQLTPTQITSLLGTNHLWADCGEISCEYVADTKMYIQNLLNQ